MSQVAQPPSLVKVIGTALAFPLNPVADATIALTAPGAGTWALQSAEIYYVSGAPAGQAGSFFTAAAGAGTNLGTVNLTTLVSGTSRGLYFLSIKPLVPSTIYYRNTTQSTVAATVNIVVYGVQVA